MIPGAKAGSEKLCDVPKSTQLGRSKEKDQGPKAMALSGVSGQLPSKRGLGLGPQPHRTQERRDFENPQGCRERTLSPALGPEGCILSPRVQSTPTPLSRKTRGITVGGLLSVEFGGPKPIGAALGSTAPCFTPTTRTSSLSHQLQLTQWGLW